MNPFRRKAKPVLGSVYPSTYRLDDDIEKLYDKIAGLKSLDDLARHPGWKEVEDAMLRIVRKIDRTGIWLHAGDPVKYENELKAARAARMAILLLLGVVTRGGRKMPEVLKNLHRKMEIMNDLPETVDPSGQPPRSR